MVTSFVTTSPGLLALALFVTIVSLFCAIFSLAAQRIQAGSRPDTALLTPEVLAHVREKARRDAAARAVNAPKPIGRDPH